MKKNNKKSIGKRKAPYNKELEEMQPKKKPKADKIIIMTANTTNTYNKMCTPLLPHFLPQLISKNYLFYNVSFSVPEIKCHRKLLIPQVTQING